MTQHHLQNSKTNKNMKSNKLNFFLKIFIIIVWGLFLLANTWTESLGRLLFLHSVGFRWVSNPNFLSFFYFDISEIHTHYVIVKLGHFFGFAVMDFLLYKLTKNHKSSIVISIIFAFFTEFFQLFFGRDGRFYDFLIDLLGVISTFIILKKDKFSVKQGFE